MLTLDSHVRPNDREVAGKVLDGEAIIMNLATGMYYSLDAGAGAFLWSLVEGGCRLADAAAAVAARFEVSLEQAGADVLGLADDLLRERIVLEADTAPSPAPRPEAPAGARVPYEPPRLHVYRDMQDLLALDPPMPLLEEGTWPAPDQRPE
jgi:hypothetical protein